VLRPSPPPAVTSERLLRPPRTTSRAWRLRALVGLLIAIAIGLRVWRLDLIVYEVDEAALLRLAEDLLRLGRVPLSGPIFSAGIPSAPTFIYLLAPVVAISRDPAFVAGAIALANVLGVIGTVWLGWHGFGPLAGLTAGALYAVNPWAIFYARRIWQPELVPPLAVLLFIALELAVVDRRVWWAAATFPILAVAAGVHPSAATLAPLLLAPAVVLVYARAWLALVVGCALAGLTTVPYVLHQVQTRWVDVANIRYYASLHTWFDLDSLAYAVGLATGLAARNDPAVPRFDRAFPDVVLQLAAGLETAVLLAAIVFAVFTITRRRTRSKPGLVSAPEFPGGLAKGFGPRRLRLLGLLGWLALPIVLTVRHTLPLQSHYFLVLYPAPFLLVGALVAWLFRSRGARVAQVVTVSGIVATLAIQATAVLSVMRFMGADNDACFGPLLPTAQAAVGEIVALGRPPDTSHAAIELQAPDSLPLAYLLRSQFPVVDLAGAGDIGLGSRMPGDRSDTAGEPRPTPAPADQPLILTTVQARDLSYPGGVRVVRVGYSDQPGGDQRVVVGISWQVQPEARSNHAFVWDLALVDAAGQVALRHTGVDHILSELQGQRIVSWLTLDPSLTDAGVLVAGAYTARLQLRDAWVPQVVPFSDAQSGHSADTLELGPITIPAPHSACGTG
jgi:hypothetical protein